MSIEMIVGLLLVVISLLEIGSVIAIVNSNSRT